MNTNNPKEVFDIMENDKNLEKFSEYMESIANTLWGWQWGAMAFWLTTVFQVNKRLINALDRSSKSANFLARVWIWATIVLWWIWIRITIILSK